MPLLDRAERSILFELQRQGRLANVELAQRVGLSESPCLRRVRALEERGLIAGYAFVQVSLEKDDQRREAFLTRVENEEHIVECHAMSGAYDYLLKVVARSIDHFSELVMQGILRFDGVKDIESSFSLQTVKESAPLPLGAASA
jgi:Lrp/AsnC family leucine-responsive transcriptional regulator